MGPGLSTPMGQSWSGQTQACKPCSGQGLPATVQNVPSNSAASGMGAGMGSGMGASGMGASSMGAGGSTAGPLGEVGDNLTGGISGIGKQAYTIFPLFSGSSEQSDSDYAKWKQNADYKTYRKFRKYYQFRSFSDGKCDNWNLYGEFKRGWKSRDKDAFRADFRRWQRNWCPNEKSLWMEWLAWKSLFQTLQDQYANKKVDTDKLWSQYRKFHRNTDVKSFKRYYGAWRWKQHADRNGMDWKDADAYGNWYKSNKLSGRELDDSYRRWKRNYDDSDYRHWYWYSYEGHSSKFDDFRDYRGYGSDGYGSGDGRDYRGRGGRRGSGEYNRRYSGDWDSRSE